MNTVAFIFVITGLFPLGGRADDQELAPIWLDNVEFWPDGENGVQVPWKPLEDAYSHPDLFDMFEEEGYDWTLPFPSSKLRGFSTRLRTMDKIPLPEDLGGVNETTAVTSLKWSIPESMLENGQPKMIHSTWTVCRHTFITVNANDTQGDHECTFIPDQCRQDFVKELTEDWMTEADTPCSRLGLDPAPQSCNNVLGFMRGGVMQLSTKYFEDEHLPTVYGLDQPDIYDFKIGTGFDGVGTNLTALQKAAERTYIIATVWGYSEEADESTRKVPEVSFTCLRGQDVENFDPSGSQVPDKSSSVTTSRWSSATLLGLTYALSAL